MKPRITPSASRATSRRGASRTDPVRILLSAPPVITEGTVARRDDHADPQGEDERRRRLATKDVKSKQSRFLQAEEGFRKEEAR
jgi:hypothetical protein